MLPLFSAAGLSEIECKITAFCRYMQIIELFFYIKGLTIVVVGDVSAYDINDGSTIYGLLRL